MSKPVSDKWILFFTGLAITILFGFLGVGIYSIIRIATSG